MRRQPLMRGKDNVLGRIGWRECHWSDIDRRKNITRPGAKDKGGCDIHRRQSLVE